jgi:ribosomal protein S27AE
MTRTAQPEIQPLCDRDQSPMIERILEDQLIEYPFPAYCCEMSDCTRAYTTSLGYFNVEGSGILLDKFGKQTCPNCGASMYLAAYNPETEDETWRCAGCGQERLAA